MMDGLKIFFILDKKNIHNNSMQVINQVTQVGSHTNRYDVTILVNGLPLVQIELKKRGGSLKEAFEQIHRYSKESFNSENSLYKYIQIFVISNGLIRATLPIQQLKIKTIMSSPVNGQTEK